eukprot:COSAG06_NODE_31424_length_521_cov_45.071090_1_plen_45_part_10
MRFECELCSRSFERLTKLQAHHRKAHTNAPKQKIMCTDPQCGKYF